MNFELGMINWPACGRRKPRGARVISFPVSAFRFPLCP
jgi:hypothetical protein